MNDRLLNSRSFIEITLRGEENRDVSLYAVSNLLRDFNSLYVILRLTTDPAYDNVSLDNPGYRVQRKDKLFVRQLSIASPFLLITDVAIAGGIATVLWGLVQTVDKIANMPLDLKKKKLDIEKVKMEIAEMKARQGSIPTFVSAPVDSLPADQNLLSLTPTMELVQRGQPSNALETTPSEQSSDTQRVSRRPRPVVITDPEDEQQIQERIASRGGQPAYNRVTERLRTSPIQISDIEIEIKKASGGSS